VEPREPSRPSCALEAEEPVPSTPRPIADRQPTEPGDNDPAPAASPALPAHEAGAEIVVEQDDRPTSPCIPPFEPEAPLKNDEAPRSLPIPIPMQSFSVVWLSWTAIALAVLFVLEALRLLAS
jgi:hypothetical protein